MIVQTITYVLAAACGVAVSAWSALAAPHYLKPYFRRAHAPTPKSWHLLAMTAFSQAAVFAFGLKDPFLIATVPLTGLFALMVLTDAKTHRLPNVLTFLAYAVFIPATVVSLILRLFHPVGEFSLFGVFIGMAVWALPLWVLHIVGGGIGRGDVKLAPVIGAWLGLYGAGVAFGGLLTALILGGVYALWMLVRGKASLRSAIAFGPAMVAGALVAWLVSGGMSYPW